MSSFTGKWEGEPNSSMEITIAGIPVTFPHNEEIKITFSSFGSWRREKIERRISGDDK